MLLNISESQVQNEDKRLFEFDIKEEDGDLVAILTLYRALHEEGPLTLDYRFSKTAHVTGQDIAAEMTKKAKKYDLNFHPNDLEYGVSSFEVFIADKFNELLKKRGYKKD